MLPRLQQLIPTDLADLRNIGNDMQGELSLFDLLQFLQAFATDYLLLYVLSPIGTSANLLQHQNRIEGNHLEHRKLSLMACLQVSCRLVTLYRLDHISLDRVGHMFACIRQFVQSTIAQYGLHSRLD